ncbi:MAG: GNAT family N-acetyltransferase [Bacteroidota bacterium]
MYDFKILRPEDILEIVPLVYELNEGRISKEVLKERFIEMATQNYECAVVLYKQELVGVTGIWYCTRHYVGKSVELDHVYLKKEHRNKGVGNKFLDWIQNHSINKGVESIELNTYVQNYPSHKFYYNQGFEILGYHFLKKL